MDLKGLTTYQSAFNLLRVAFIAVLIALVTGLIGMNYYYSEKQKELTNRVYLMENSGNVSTATAKYLSKEDLQIVVADHIKDCYSLIFAFDQFNFERNLEKGLNLMGASGREIYQQYRDDNVLRRIKTNNAIVSIVIDEPIKIDVNSNPMRAQVKAIQTTRVGENSISRNMNSNVFNIQFTSRSDLNPHGLILTDFRIENQSTIEE